MRPYFPLCVTSLVLVACARSAADVETTTAPVDATGVVETGGAVVTAVAPDSGTFVLEQAGTALITDRFVRTGDRLQGELTTASGQRATYTARLGPGGAVTQLVARDYGTGTAETAMSQATLTFTGDTVRVLAQQGDSTRQVAVATPPNTVPYLNPSPAFMELILRRARAIGGDTVQVPLFVLGSGGQTVPATVTFTQPGTAELTVAGVDIVLSTDPTGRIVGGLVPSQNVTIERQ